MKKIYAFLTAVLYAGMIQAQLPALFNYQGIARDMNGDPLPSQSLGLRISILENSPGGTELFKETHSVTTNSYGLYNVAIGSGTNVLGQLDTIDWIKGTKYLKIEMDPAGGTSYTDVGTPTQLLSTPFSMASLGLQSSNDGGLGIRSNFPSFLWQGLFEGGVYRGYFGSYSGKNEDVDFGTGATNADGSVHLTIAAVPKLTVDSIGNVGIGTRFPEYRLRVDGVTGSFNDNGIRIYNTSVSSGWSFYSSSSGNMIIGRTSNLGQFDGTSGVYTSLSDSRLKTNIRDLENVLPALMNIGIKRYEFARNNPDRKQSIGVMAQELQAAFPEFVSVHTANDGNPLTDNQLGVDYAGLSTLAIKAVQEQQAVIEDLKKQVEELSKTVETLKRK